MQNKQNENRKIYKCKNKRKFIIRIFKIHKKGLETENAKQNKKKNKAKADLRCVRKKITCAK